MVASIAVLRTIEHDTFRDLDLIAVLLVTFTPDLSIYLIGTRLYLEHGVNAIPATI